jgi:hypothetical protein
MGRKNRRDPLPDHFSSIEEAAEFWETHSLADYSEYWKPVKVDIRIKETPRYYALEERIAERLARYARQKRISPEVLLNLWTQEKLSKI